MIFMFKVQGHEAVEALNGLMRFVTDKDILGALVDDMQALKR